MPSSHGALFGCIDLREVKISCSLGIVLRDSCSSIDKMLENNFFKSINGGGVL